MLEEEAIKKYGERMWTKMINTGYLSNITVEIRKDGKIDIPESDINRAFRVATGGNITIWDWD